MNCPDCNHELFFEGNIVKPKWNIGRGKGLDPSDKLALYKCVNKNCMNYQKIRRYDEVLKKFV